MDLSYTIISGFPCLPSWRFFAGNGGKHPARCESFACNGRACPHCKCNRALFPFGSGGRRRSLPLGEETTLTSASELPVVGWYSADGAFTQYRAGIHHCAERKYDGVCAVLKATFFLDIGADAWYLDDVMEAAERGLAGGTSLAHFEPEGKMNRAIFATVLYRAEGGKRQQSRHPLRMLSREPGTPMQ